MKIKSNEPTMCYQYGNDEKEYIFCVKGRPFPCLVSPYIPTPTASLLDYDLVKSLGLKMVDLRCEKFSFCGHKMRILGKCAITAQCIHDGVSSGAFQIKANVVLDLAKNLDTECVAGTKMAAQLKGDRQPSAPSSPRATSPPGKRASSPPPSVPAAGPPRTPPSRSPQTPRSPPGFPTPRYSASPGIATAAKINVFRVAPDGHELSPRAANVRALSAAFRNADLRDNNVDELTDLLEELDPDGELGDDGYDTTYHLTNGLHYHYGHGRYLCSAVKCTNREKYGEYNYQYEYPSNCAFNRQWCFPDNFTPCGDNCLGGFCQCLGSYHYPDKRKGERRK